MAHKNKKNNVHDNDNSRRAFRYRLRNNCLTENDKKRLETKDQVTHNSKQQALIQSGMVVTKIKRGGKGCFNWKK